MTQDPGYIKPSDPHVSADYWVTRRSADAAPGYDLKLPDMRFCFRWNGNGAWITGYREGIPGGGAILSGLHSNNGWRIEGAADERLYSPA
jgi:hypothetical protein